MKQKEFQEDSCHGPPEAADGKGRPAKWLSPEFLLMGIFIFALCVRLLYISQVASTPLLHGLALDSKEYDSLALQILKGNHTHADFIYLNAFYPYFLAGVYFVFGHSPLAVGLVQAIMDALSCFLVYYIAWRLFNKSTALIAAFTYACYGIAIFYTGLLLATSVIIFLALLLVASLLFAREKRRMGLFFVSGILFGLVVLARSNLFLFLFVLPLWFFPVMGRKTGLQKAAQGFGLFLVGFLFLTLPISARNYAIHERFSPFSVQGGISFYMGNNPKATGRFMSPEGISLTPVKLVKTSIQSAERALGTSLTPSEASRYWLFSGLRFIRDTPFDAFILYAKKLGLFWRKEEISLNIDYYLSRNLVPVLQFPFVSFGVVAPLAVLGMILSARRRDDTLLVTLFVVASMVSVVAFFIAARYRMCVIPFLVIFSAYALHWFVKTARGKEFRALFVVTVSFLVLWTGMNLGFHGLIKADSVSKIHYRNLGLVYIREGRPDLAAAELEKALSFDPGYAEAYSGLGFALQRQGKLDEAIGHFQKAIEIKPELDEAHNNLGAIFLQQGKLDEAIDHFRQALRIKPDHVQAHQNLGAVLVRQGKFEEATNHLSQALELQPDSAEGHYNLGLALAALGNLKEGMAHMSEAARINPALDSAFQDFQQRMKH